MLILCSFVETPRQGRLKRDASSLQKNRFQFTRELRDAEAQTSLRRNTGQELRQRLEIKN
jgi:hypothetical protein